MLLVFFSSYEIFISDCSDLDEDELRAIASRPDYVFEVDNFDALDDIQDQLRKTTCENTSGYYSFIH